METVFGMNRPEFTNEELYFIRYYLLRESTHLGDNLWGGASKLFPAFALIVFGLLQDSDLAVVIGMLIWLFFEIRDFWIVLSASRCLSSIFRKYESSIEIDGESQGDGS